MFKNLTKLGTPLTKGELKQINGGGLFCNTPNSCPAGQCCSQNNCRPNDGVTLCEQQPDPDPFNPGGLNPGSNMFCWINKSHPSCSSYPWYTG